MKILLDECIDRRLAREIKGHVVRTVPGMGWAGLKNGHLLKLAEKQFDVFVTMDRNLTFQQPVHLYDIAVLVLSAKTNRLDDLLPLVPVVMLKLGTCRSGRVLRIVN